MKVLHLFISKSSDGLLGLDSWRETNPFLMGASVGKKGWFWFCKILLSFSAADWCYHLETWWGTPYGCSSLTLWSLRTWKSGFHLAPQDSCGKQCGDWALHGARGCPGWKGGKWRGREQHSWHARGFLSWVRTVSVTDCSSAVLHGSQQQCRTGILQRMHPFLHGKWVFCHLRHCTFKQQIVRLLYLIVRLEYLI